MIRLGSLAGYPFEGPRVLGGWTAPAEPGVFVVLYRPEPETNPERWAVIYVGHSDDLSTEGLPWRHPRSGCWTSRAAKWQLAIATYAVPGGLPSHREQITRELCAVYRPQCNEQQFDQTWREEWIQDYSAPATTGPLTTDRQPGRRPDAADD